MTVRVLNVWWGGRIVGQFTQDKHGLGLDGSNGVLMAATRHLKSYPIVGSRVTYLKTLLWSVIRKVVAASLAVHRTEPG